MSGNLGVTAIKGTLTVLKLGAISILQAVKKDGFQPVDLFAPLDSAIFKAEVEKNKAELVNVLPELADLDAGDVFELTLFAWGVVKDVKTELSPALLALKKYKAA